MQTRPRAQGVTAQRAYLLYKNNKHPTGLRKHPTIVVHFSDGHTESFPVLVDIRKNPDDLSVAEETLRLLQRKIAQSRFEYDDYFEQKDQLTIGEFRDIFLSDQHDQLEEGKLAPKTVEQRECAYNAFFKYIDPHTRLQDLHEDDIKHFSKQLQKIDRSPSTINDYLRSLKRSFNWGSPRYLQHNPFGTYELLPEKKEDKYLSIEDIQRIREYFGKKKQDWPLQAMDLSLHTGIRRQSLTRITTADIIKKEIDGQPCYFLNVLEKWHRKKGPQYRPVYLIAPALRIIINRLDILADEKQIRNIIEQRPSPMHYPAYRRRARENHLFFEVKTDNTYTQMMREAALALNIDATWHSLRHSAATYMREQGVKKEVRMAILGHKSESSHDIYSKETLRGLVRGMEHYTGV